MEQPLENHMRLPPPVTNSSADSATTLHQHQSSHQQAHAVHLQAPYHPNGSLSSPPFSSNNANAGLLPRAASTKHGYTSSSSSLSPRPLGQVPSHSPPTYAYSQQQNNHDPATLKFPDAPSNELAPLQFNAFSDSSLGSLPSLASLTGASATSSLRFNPTSAIRDTSYSPPPPKLRTWPSGNPYSAYYTGGHGHSAEMAARMDIDSMSHGPRAPMSPEMMNGRASSVSLDDPDVRMAAEALGDLKADFVSSPSRNTPMPTPSSNHFGTPGPPEAEPLLSLVMTSGSLLARPIGGTVTAYNTTKNYSPGFIKAPVEYVEGVVGSGFHMSGIEGGVRWLFRGKGRHPSSSDLETGEGSNKRRKVASRSGSTSASRRGDALASLQSSEFAFSGCSSDKDRRLSVGTVDTLPAYDDVRSPAYTEDDKNGDQTTPTNSRPNSTTPQAWQSRLIMSTSGLSIAMSEESLRSLKYCLSWLRWANNHIGRVISALKSALEKYDHEHAEDAAMMNDRSGAQDPEAARRKLGACISALRADVLKTLTGVIETVSKYAGGALPENARMLVRRHLTSLPQRFRLATLETSDGSPAPTEPATTEEGKAQEVREGAQRVLVMAKEGLDMMAQVSVVLDGTIISAEEWCARLGKKKREERGQDQEQPEQGQEQGQQQQGQLQTVPLAGVGIDGDVKMG